MTGYVVGLFAGPALFNPAGCSMPKRGLTQVEISLQGLEGDVNRYRDAKRGGDLDMAVVLLCTADLAHLQSCGHDLRPGDIGENILLSGIALESLRPDVKLNLGAVQLQISRTCDPCESLATLPQIGKQGLKRLLKDSLTHRGWYARVLLQGNVRLGDEAIIID